MSLSEAIETFIEAKTAEGRSFATIKMYRSCLRSFRRFTGDLLLSEVERQTIRAYLANLRGRTNKQGDNPYRRTVHEPLSPTTIRTYERHVKVFFNWLFDEGMIDSNPGKRVKMLPKVKHPPKAISQADAMRMIAATGESKLPERDRALFLFLATTGCRAGGAIGLTLERLDLDRGLAQVIEKGDKARFVPLLPVTIEAIRVWLQVRSAPGEVREVFVSATKEPLSYSGLYQMCRRTAIRAGVYDRYNPHAFRHFFGVKWIENGGDVSILKDVMGHSSINVTMEYLRFDVEAIQKAHSQYSPLSGVSSD